MKFNQKISWLIVMAGLTAVMISCEKEANDYAPERPIGGFSSSSEVGAENKLAFWAFENSLTDSVAGITGIAKGTTFAPGKKGQAFKGAVDGYALFDNPGAKIIGLQSFTFAFWMNTQQPVGAAAGIFSLNNTKDFWGNLDIYMEPYAPGNVPSADTALMKVHINNDNAVWKGQFIDTKIGGAIGKWVHFATTYDGATSVFNIYANGQAVGVNSAGNPANTKGPKLRGDDPANGDVFYGPIKFVNATKMVMGTFQFQTVPSLTTTATAQNWAQSYTGLLDEFHIYDKALSAADVNALFKLENLGR